jgi:tRNA-specific 2-thiouridylase
VNWLVDRPQGASQRTRACEAKIRYNAACAPATLECLDDDRLRVTFAAPQYGVAPGQAVVCYDGDRVLCGGWIE